MGFIQFLRDLSALRKSLMVLKDGQALQSGRPFGEGRTLDVWWVVQDGGLLLLIPFLLKRSKVFAGCQLRLFAVMTGCSPITGTRITGALLPYRRRRPGMNER